MSGRTSADVALVRSLGDSSCESSRLSRGAVDGQQTEKYPLHSNRFHDETNSDNHTGSEVSRSRGFPDTVCTGYSRFSQR